VLDYNLFANKFGAMQRLSPHDAPPRRLRRLSTVWAGHPFPRYFVTACTADRMRVLANAEYHARLRAFLLESPSRYGWHVLRYVIMPDHLHLMAVTTDQTSLGGWIKALKAVTAQREFRWQAGYFDHVLRNDENESEKWNYVRDNPVRAGLVASAEEWLYGGELRFEYDAPPAGSHCRPRASTRRLG